MYEQLKASLQYDTDSASVVSIMNIAGEGSFFTSQIYSWRQNFGKSDWLRWRGNARVEIESTPAPCRRSQCYDCASVILWTGLNEFWALDSVH